MEPCGNVFSLPALLLALLLLAPPEMQQVRFENEGVPSLEVHT